MRCSHPLHARKNDQVTWLNLEAGQSGKDVGDPRPRGEFYAVSERSGDSGRSVKTLKTGFPTDEIPLGSLRVAHGHRDRAVSEPVLHPVPPPSPTAKRSCVESRASEFLASPPDGMRSKVAREAARWSTAVRRVGRTRDLPASASGVVTDLTARQHQRHHSDLKCTDNALLSCLTG